MLDSVTGMTLYSTACMSASTRARSEAKELSSALGDTESLGLLGLYGSLIFATKGFKRD